MAIQELDQNFGSGLGSDPNHGDYFLEAGGVLPGGTDGRQADNEPEREEAINQILEDAWVRDLTAVEIQEALTERELINPESRMQGLIITGLLITNFAVKRLRSDRER